MALKLYEWRGSTWQFEESKAPADAVPVKPKREKKAMTPNKSRSVQNKEA